MCVIDGKYRVNAMLRDVMLEGRETPVFSSNSRDLCEEYWASFWMLRQLVETLAQLSTTGVADILDALIPSEGSCTCAS